MKFYSSVRLDIRRIGAIKKEDEFIGNRTRIKVVKNKLAPPFQKVEIDLIFGRGFDPMNDLLDLAVCNGHITKAGSWYSYRDERIGQGKDTAAAFLAENDEVRELITRALLAPAVANTG